MKTFPTIALGAVAAVALVAAGYAAGRFFAPVTFVVAPTAEIVRTVQAQGGGEDALALSKALSEADALRAEAAALKERLADLQAAPKEEAAPEPRVCPYCKQEIADDATRCPHCTSKLEGFDGE